MKLLFTGDYYPVKEIEIYNQENYAPELIFGDLLPIIRNTDISIFNQEYPITTSNEKINKFGPNLKGDPICLKAIKNAGFTLACLANNHSYDFGDEGIRDTINFLKQNGIEYTGVGFTLEEAKNTYFKEVNDTKIAIINIAENEFNTATMYHGGANPLDIIDNIHQIKHAKSIADYVFLIIHGGTDFCHYPSPRMLKQYRFYAEQGVAGIIAHHTHHVAGYEVHNGVPIFYSLGNLIYPYRWNIHCLETIAIQFELKPDKKPAFDVFPFKFNPDSMKLENMNGEEKAEFDLRFEKYCSVLSNPTELKAKWLEHIRSPRNRAVYWTLLSKKPYLYYRIAKKLHAFNLLERFLLRKKSRFLGLWNLVRCETHRDAVLSHFEDLFNEKYNK